MVRSTIATALLMGWVCGCAAAPPAPILTPLEVKVPVGTPVYCKVGNLDKPELPISRLKPDSAPADSIRAYAATVAILKGAVRQRDLVLAACASPLVDGAEPSPGGEPASKPASEAPQ